MLICITPIENRDGGGGGGDWFNINHKKVFLVGAVACRTGCHVSHSYSCAPEFRHVISNLIFPLAHLNILISLS